MDVNLLFGEFNSQSFGLVHAQELRDADCYESCLALVLELFVYFLNLRLHVVNAIEKALLALFR